MAKHKVTIQLVDRNAPDWRVECSACSCSMGGFSGEGLAEQAAERYHEAKGTTIHSIKVRRNPA